VPLFLQMSLGGGVGYLKLEALREEVHGFDRSNRIPGDSCFMLHCSYARNTSRKGLRWNDCENRSQTSETDAKTPASSAGVVQPRADVVWRD
jgi:hypothetical protein